MMTYHFKNHFTSEELKDYEGKTYSHLRELYKSNIKELSYLVDIVKGKRVIHDKALYKKRILIERKLNYITNKMMEKNMETWYGIEIHQGEVGRSNIEKIETKRGHSKKTDTLKK